MDNSIKNENGELTKNWVEAALKAQKNWLDFTYEKNVVAPKELRATKRFHFKVTGSNGKVLWILVTGDVYDGGLQTNMFEYIYQMVRLGAWKANEVFVAVQRAGTTEEKQWAYDTLKGIVGNDQDLLEVLYGIMPKD